MGLPDGAYVVTSVGNCSPVKNHEAIIAALPDIARLTGREVTYLHAGSGEDEATEAALARALPSTVTVRFLGTVRDVLPVLWASDVFCMPSLYEGVGIAALEALACGVPSVLSDAEGMRDVHAEAAAVRFQPPTAEGVAQGVAELLAVEEDVLAQEAACVAADVRAQRNVRVKIQELVSIYRGGAA